MLPGDVLAVGEDYVAGLNTYRLGSKIVASTVGLLELREKVVQVIPLRGCYMPRAGDLVIGRVVDWSMSGWSIDINSPYLAALPIGEFTKRRIDLKRHDLRDILSVGDVVKARVLSYDRTQGPILTVKEPDLGKVREGRLVTIIPTKVPRLIGKRGSMVEMISRETGCKIVVGQNGVVLVTGRSKRDEEIAERAIRMVEREAHLAGLTDRVTKLIRELKEGGA